MTRSPRVWGCLGSASRAPAGILLLLAVQLLLALRVGARLVRTARGVRIPRVDAAPAARVSVIVPVLDERHRLQPCLDGLTRQGPEVVEILVVDGGSSDGTPDLVRAASRVEPRIRLIEAGPAPPDGNGKVHNLQAGLDQADAGVEWVLTIDADVRPEPALAASLLAFAQQEGVPALSVATRQRVSGPAEGMLHPALLTTLVYRFGIPGSATDRSTQVQANGQCFLLRRDVLEAVGGFAPLRGSLCEDVTLARRLAAAGRRVGFYETAGLVSVAMYAGWLDAWRNWTRSLPTRDDHFGPLGWLGLAEVALVQAAPLPLALACRRSRGRGVVCLLGRLNLLLLAVRLGVLVGTARAYAQPPWSYWLSPVCDVPAAVGVWWGALRRRHAWRGRPIVRGGSR